MRARHPFALLVALALASCAEGQVEGDPADVPTGTDPDVLPGGDDVQVSPPEDVQIPSSDDVVKPGDDAGARPDVVTPRDDVPVGVDVVAPPDDVATTFDAATPLDAVTPPDVVTGLDVVTAPDVATPRDVVITPDSGTMCVAPRAVCSGRCVDTATDATNCGACGSACSGATPTCSAGRCGAATCPAATSNCDGNAANGCEVSHRSTETCAAAANLGTWCGDTGCGFLCPGTSSRVVATRTGRASAWFRGRTNECSNCPARLEVSFTLTVPPGVDYDLYVYDGCGGTVLGSSLLLAGQTDRVTISRSGDLGSDSFNWWVEVRYLSGSSCSTWSLSVQTRSSSGSSC